MTFLDNGTPLSGAVVPQPTGPGGLYAFTTSSGFGVGLHSFSARFTPTDPSAWGGASPSPSVGASYSVPGASPDCHVVVVTVDPGALTITTPYTAAQPFDLGHLTLSPDGSHLQASASLGDGSAAETTVPIAHDIGIGDTTVTLGSVAGIRVGQRALFQGYAPGSPIFPATTLVVSIDPKERTVTLNKPAEGNVAAKVGADMSFTGSGGITIADSRSGGLPWTASVTATDFSGPGGVVINAQNLSLTQVAPIYLPGNALNPGTSPVVTNDLPSSAGLHPVGGYAPTDDGTDGSQGRPKQSRTRWWVEQGPCSSMVESTSWRRRPLSWGTTQPP